MNIDPKLLAHATPTELRLIEQALQAEVALSSPAEYASYCDPTFLRPEHVELISDTVVRLVEGRLMKQDGTPYRKLMVAMPPRHGKSEMISKFTPAWFVTRYPELRCIVASYEGEFAASWGRKARELVEAHPELGITVSQSSRAAAQWDVSGRKGGMSTAGAGGPVTGKGGSLLIVDDPVKNAEEAQSPTMRERTWDWYRSTFLSRGQPGLPVSQSGAVILLQTRWHEDDLAGRLLKEEGDEWFLLSLPALAGTNDPLGRRPGEALWPERYDVSALAALRDSMGPYWWAALYQQTPQIEGGGLFRIDALRYHTYNRTDRGAYVRLLVPDAPPKVVPEAKLARFMVVDLAASLKTTADYSVYAHFGVTPDKDLVLLDAFRARIEGAEHMAHLERLYNAWKPRFCAIERATYGLSLIQTAARTGRIPIREVKPDFDKVSRAYAAGALAEAGRLYLPKDAPWLAEWVAELVGFPNATHDDCVDVTAYAAHLLNQQLMPPRRPGEREPATIEEKIWARIDEKRKARRRHPLLGSGF
ncbi:MAG TPA: phage terminase large subunit [Acidimicrobiales bacterium]|nr:phage terminase large subunit [Acidimicrobiales bacterium]